MSPNPSAFSMSQRHEYVDLPADKSIPQILSAAWSVCTPAEVPLVDQLNNEERAFLVLLAEYIMTSLDSPLSASDPSTVLSDILMTARHRLSLLHKETTLSPNYVVISAVLHLLTNLFASDNMKYTSREQFLESYPDFTERSESEIEKLFHTANWMHILFQITTAKKNKGMVMTVVPKFIEGNSVQYVTGSGQTQPTRDRVTIYENEGNVKPIKRLHRKTKKQLSDLAKQTESSKKQTGPAKRKATYVKRKSLKTLVAPKSKVSGVKESHSPVVPFQTHQLKQSYQETKETIEPNHDDVQPPFPQLHRVSSDSQPFTSSEGGYQSYLPLPLSFSMAPPIPVRRSQSSFSQAAAAIASFNQNVVQCGATDNTSSSQSSSYVCSPRECYLDVDANGTMRKTTSSNSVNSCSYFFDSSGMMSPRGHGANGSDQLKMLREVSEDSDISTDMGPGDRGNMLPPFLTQTQQSQHQHHLQHMRPVKFPSSSSLSGLGSPLSQTRNLERCPTSSLDEGDVDFELLEALSRQVSHSWLTRSTSASSMSGRESSLSLRA
jgi:hypothetical protein